MLKSYFLIGLRNILKNKMISLFNIAGLSVAFGCVIVIFIFIEYNFSVDKFHVNGDRVFLITHTQENTGRDYGTTPVMTGKFLKAEVPGIESMVRLQRENVTVVSKSGEPFHEYVTFTDPEYFNIFSFTLKWGQPASLSDPSKVIISDEVARKYFGNDNPIGENFELYLSDGRRISVSVSGVANPFPLKRSFDFNFLVNSDVLIAGNADNESWNSFADATFIKMSAAGDINTILPALEKFQENYNTKNPDEQITAFGWEPLSTLASQAYRIRDVVTRGFGPPSGKIAFSIIGLLLITLACLNYINTATAIGVARLKEIGIRKVVGSARSSIIAQFMTENFIINLLSLLMGIFLAWSLLLPGFASLFQINLTFDLSNLYLITFLTGILLLTSLLSGAYPALYVSRYKPVAILSGINKIGTRSIFSKVLLSFQFMFSFIYIVASILFISNETYQRNRDWGYDYKNLLIIQPDNESSYAYLKNELRNRADVQQITGANHHIGRAYDETLVKIDTFSVKVHRFDVDSLYLETLKIKLSEGASFSGMTGRHDVVVNETFLRYAEWDYALDKTIVMNGETWYVKGVVKDFRYTDFQRRIEPVIFTMSSGESHNYLLARVKDVSNPQFTEFMKATWKAASPHEPYTAWQQEEIIDGYFILMAGHSKVMIFSAIVAVTLACLGLFGLVYLNIVARIKDYSIMKILGINTVSLIRQVSKIFIWFLIGAIFIGFPISVWMSQMLFRIVYTDHIPVTMSYPLIGAMLLIVMAGLTVSFLIIKLLRQNPVDALRN